MTLEPNVIVLYVDDIALSSQFYTDLLGLSPVEASPTFTAFKLANGMGVGLKAKHSVKPAAESCGGIELAFTVKSNEQVDGLYADWERCGIRIAQPPFDLPFGYTFLAQDPDGHRLRVVALK